MYTHDDMSDDIPYHRKTSASVSPVENRKQTPVTVFSVSKDLDTEDTISRSRSKSANSTASKIDLQGILHRAQNIESQVDLALGKLEIGQPRKKSTTRKSFKKIDEETRLRSTSSATTPLSKTELNEMIVSAQDTKQQFDALLKYAVVNGEAVSGAEKIVEDVEQIRRDSGLVRVNSSTNSDEMLKSSTTGTVLPIRVIDKEVESKTLELEEMDTQESTSPSSSKENVEDIMKRVEERTLKVKEISKKKPSTVATSKLRRSVGMNEKLIKLEDKIVEENPFKEHEKEEEEEVSVSKIPMPESNVRRDSVKIESVENGRSSAKEKVKSNLCCSIWCCSKKYVIQVEDDDH